MNATKHEGIICESARVFVVIAKTQDCSSFLLFFFFLFSFFFFFNPIHQPTNQPKASLIRKLVECEGLDSFAVLLESKHDILKNEALENLFLFVPGKDLLG